MPNFAGVSGGANFSSLGEIITKLIGPFFVLAGMISLMMLVWGGLRYMTARGDPKSADSARAILTSAVIGLLLVFGGAAIFYLFGGALGFDFFGFEIVSPVYAQGGVSIGETVIFGDGFLSDSFNSIGGLFTVIIRLALAIAGVVFLAMMVWGGFGYLNSGGDSKAADSARNTLTNSGIGLLIILISFFIIEVITNLFGLPSIF